MKTILLVTEQFDPTTDNLLQVLRGRGCPILRWNLDRYPNASSLTYRFSAQGFDTVISADGRFASSDDIESVWYRASRARGVPDSLNTEEREFATREADAVLNSLAAVTHWNWINDPRCDREAARKPGQLAIAQRLGLRIPRTVITNDPKTVKEFREQCAGMTVYKSLSPAMNLAPGRMLYTSPLTEETLSRIDLIQDSPGIFQELVPKDYEVRLTVVGESMFAARILSQQSERAKLDWRIAPYDLKHEEIQLPGDVREKVCAFMAECGLVYSCLDFVVTPEGQYVFLESNPRGQYLWIEEFTGMPITDAIADALMN